MSARSRLRRSFSKGLQKLEYRGYDSAGIAVLDGSTIELAKACGVIKNLFAKTHDGEDLHGYIGLGHTRWATHGAPTEANAHPHVSNDGKFAIVQNGIIENFMELREMLKAKGFVFHSETDTEVIVHLLDMYYTGDGNLKDTVLKTLGRLEGSYALGILCADCPDQLFHRAQRLPAHHRRRRGRELLCLRCHGARVAHEERDLS